MSTPRTGMFLLLASGVTGFAPLPPSRLPLPASPHLAPVSFMVSSSSSALDRLLRSKALEQLPSPKVVDYVDGLPGGQRCTAADVAAGVGLPVGEAKEGLVRLAAALAAEDATVIEVDGSGQVAYSFPVNAAAVLRRRSRRARWSGRWRNSIRPVLGKVGRVAFGAGLVANVVTVYTLIAAVAASSSSDNEDGRSSRGRGGGLSLTFRAVDLIDLIFYSDRLSYYDAVLSGKPPPTMGTLESIYSYVFGDGNPNRNLVDRQLAAASAVIRASGGVVVAEELAPFLDPPAPSSSISSSSSSSSCSSPSHDFDLALAESPIVDEQWVLPIISALGGVPEVTEDGDIVYAFEDLLSSALSPNLNATPVDNGALRRPLTAPRVPQQVAPQYGGGRGGRVVVATGAVGEAAETVVLEAEAPFSVAPGDKLAVASGLGFLDLAGVAVLGRMLTVQGLMPSFARIYNPLLAYALLYNGIPLMRNAVRQRRNAKIRDRNERRQAWRDVLVRGASSSPGSRAQSMGWGSASVGAEGPNHHHHHHQKLFRKLRGARDVARRKRTVETRTFGGQGSDGLAYSTKADEATEAQIAEYRSKEELRAFDQLLQRPSSTSSPPAPASPPACEEDRRHDP